MNKGAYGKAKENYQRALRILQGVDIKAAILTCLEGVAQLLGHTGQGGRAARLLGSVDALREAMGIPRSPRFQAVFDQVISDLQKSLGETLFASEREFGKRMSLDRAIAFALEEWPSV